MRFRYIFCIAFVLAPTFAFAKPPTADSKEFVPLANQLIDALQREDIVAFSQCWVSLPQAEQAVSTSEDDEEKKSDLARLKPALEKRNKNIVHAYRVIIDELKKQGKLTDLTFDRLETSRVYDVHGIRHTTSITIFVKQETIESRIVIDTCAEYQKVWYLTGNPSSITLGIDKRFIRLELQDIK